MILRLCTQVLEYSLLPITLHMIPIINHAVANRVVDTISRCLGICECLVSDEEIEVLDTPLRCEMTWTCRYGRASRI